MDSDWGGHGAIKFQSQYIYIFEKNKYQMSKLWSKFNHHILMVKIIYIYFTIKSLLDYN